MSQYAYTGFVTDVVKSPITPWMPELAVRPLVEAFGPDGLVSAVPVPIPLDPVTGAFSMSLIPSGELTPKAGGSPGVDYVIMIGRFELADDLTKVWHGTDTWQFTAVAGGGNVGGMNGGSLLAVWIGPPVDAWPLSPYPKGLYLDPLPPNPWTVVS